ncbi:MAG: endonuclease IV [Candidatus Aenigmatarchaeota archaeon]|nr:MAG: endonuclease IV [Candidatus Aenigmarchaeota archaeon]
MIRLGPAGVPISSEDRSTLAGIRKVAELGLQAMEVEFVRRVYMDRKAAEEAGKLAEELGIELSVHAPYFINLCSDDKQKVAASKKRILDSCLRAWEMGAKIVVFHPGFYGKLSPEMAFQRVKRACEEMREWLDKKGIEVLLGPETMGRQSQFGTLEEIIRLCKAVKGCRPTVDFAHIYARQGGKIDFGQVFERLKVLKLKHYHCHFTCVEYSPAGVGRGNERYHLTLDKLKPDFRPLVKEILKRKLDITLISESPILEKDALKLKQIFEEEGYRF